MKCGAKSPGSQSIVRSRNYLLNRLAEWLVRRVTDRLDCGESGHQRRAQVFLPNRCSFCGPKFGRPIAHCRREHVYMHINQCLQQGRVAELVSHWPEALLDLRDLRTCNLDDGVFLRTAAAVEHTCGADGDGWRRRLGAARDSGEDGQPEQQQSHEHHDSNMRSRIMKMERTRGPAVEQGIRFAKSYHRSPMLISRP